MLLIKNGKVWTGDAARPLADSLAIEGDRIVACGSGLQPASAEVIDLRGRMAVPGFIDNHTHFVEGGLQLSRVQLRDAATRQELARRIGEHARKIGAGKWITGGAWDHTLWSPRSLPTRQLIDDLTPENPVFVSRLDIHMSLANSLALQLAGVTRDTTDPPGGTVVRDDDGEPTGILKETAQAYVQRVIPPPSQEERVAAVRAGLAEAARLGVTGFCDMLSDGSVYEHVDLTARVSCYAPIFGVRRQSRRFQGVKGFADGSLGSATAAFFQPYSDDAGNRGLMMPEMADGQMKAAVADATARGLQIALHAIGDRANDEVLRIFESMPGARERRVRIEHAQHLDPSLIDRFARTGVIASMQPHHAVDDGRWMVSKIGPERAEWAYAFRALLDAGVTVTFGSDWPVAPLDPLAGVRAAVDRGVTFDEALRCYTANNAYAMFREHEIGRIAPGMLADVVVLSEDESQVDFTIFNGKTIYERRI
jgi:predicted amidohydrolase YtcJ